MRQKEMTVYGKRVVLDTMPNGMVVNRNLGKKMQGLGSTGPMNTILPDGSVQILGQDIPWLWIAGGGVLLVVLMMSGGGGE